MAFHSAASEISNSALSSGESRLHRTSAPLPVRSEREQEPPERGTISTSTFPLAQFSLDPLQPSDRSP
eukprot:7732764-Pyramimonas_sp.AAC.1